MNVIVESGEGRARSQRTSKDRFLMTNGINPKQIEGFSKDGDYVRTIVLTGPDGMKASVLTLGARLIDLLMPDGKPLVLSFDSLQDVEADKAYIGVPVGRVANRIARGECEVGGAKIVLDKNDGKGNHIHGGRKSWDKRIFSVVAKSESMVELYLYSPDFDQGYPCAVHVRVTYELKGQGELHILLQTKNVGGKPTITNMTMHPYFDLTGMGGKTEDSILQYTMHAPLCSRYLVLDAENIPTGEISSVANTKFDFRKPRTIASAMAGGYDQFWVRDEIENGDDAMLQEVVQITAPTSGGESVAAHVYSNCPGFQFYTPSGFEDGQPFRKFGSFAVEPSEFIDAPNHDNFPSITLHPGKHRNQRIVYKFSKSHISSR